MKCFILLACLLPQNALACTLLLPERIINGRIAGFTLTIQHASIAVANLPPGWRASIDNDPSWSTKIVGQAVVGAAFLAGPDLTSMLKLSPEPSFTCESLDPTTTNLTVEQYKNDKVTQVQVAHKFIRFVP